MSKPTHITSGIRKIFEWSLFYKSFQFLVGDYKVYKRILKILPNLEGKTIVDMGCGNGRLLDFLPKSAKYIGFDFNENYIKNAKRKFKGRSNTVFFVSDVNHEPVVPKADVIFIIGVLHHLSDESVVNVFKIAKKNLKDGGIVVSNDPVFLEKQNIVARYIIKADRGTEVRDIRGYLNLCNCIFNDTEYILLKNITNIPYDHILILNRN